MQSAEAFFTKNVDIGRLKEGAIGVGFNLRRKAVRELQVARVKRHELQRGMNLFTADALDVWRIIKPYFGQSKVERLTKPGLSERPLHVVRGTRRR